MTKISLFTNILFPLVTILFCAISQCLTALSDKQLCYDPNCSEIISLAKTILAYRANDREVMSFDINADVKVFSKSTGKRTDLWGVEINGQRGFAPKTFLNEYKILQSVLSYEVPVYKFTDDTVQTKKLESKDKVHKVHPVLKDKLSHDNKVVLSSTEAVDKDVQEEYVEAKKLQSTEKVHEAHPPLKDKLPRDDNEAPSLSARYVDKIVQDSEVIDADSISSSYEVIDGTTLYLESKQSIQPSVVTEAVHATALPDEQVSLSHPKTNLDNDADKTTFTNGKELQPDTNDIGNKFEETELLVGIPKETITKVLLKGSEGIINSTVDTASKDDTLLHNGKSKPEDESSKHLEHEGKSIDDSTEKNAEHNKKEEVTENIENEGIFASFARKFTILSNSQEITATESTVSQSTSDVPVPETTDHSNLHLQEQISENIEVKDVITEKDIPIIQTELRSNTDSSVVDKTETETQQENVHRNIEGVKISDETKTEKETSTILLENTASPSDVPSSNNFIHEDANKAAKDLSTASLVLVSDSPASIKTDINSENIRIQETSQEEKVMGNIGTEGIMASLGGGARETVTAKSTTTQSINDSEQKLSGSGGTYLENTERHIGHKETVAPISEIAGKIPETSSLTSVEKTLENIAKGALPERHTAGESTVMIDESLNHSTADIQFNEELIVHSNVNKNDNLVSDGNVPIESDEFSDSVKPSILGSEQSVDSTQNSAPSEQTSVNFNTFPYNQNLKSDAEGDLKYKNVESQTDNFVKDEDKTLPEYDGYISSEDKVLYNDEDIKADGNQMEEPELKSISDEVEVISDKTCSLDQECTTESIETSPEFLEQKTESANEEDYMIDIVKLDHNYWKTLMYLGITAFTTLAFTLGYYYIENIRRDGQFIARINKLEKELLVSTKECKVLSENLKSTKEKLHCIEDESFGSNEMVVSLKADLEGSENAKIELEDQVAMLEKDLESATEAGLELERMLREVLSSNNEVNPLAKSVEDLQARLDAQQAANESLTNALSFKAQEIDTLLADLAAAKKRCEKLEVELSQAQNELATQRDLKNNIERTLTDKVQCLEVQVIELSTDKSSLHKELKGKEMEAKELAEVINQVSSKNLDLEKLYDISRVKTEAVQLREERDELKTRLNDVEGAHQLLEEHIKLVKEEVATLSDQCKIAEKEKKDAETRLEVLSNFFKEKEAERQREEAVWLQKQGEVVSTVERIHTMQNEIQNYKQQIEMLKREIVDQEREYKNQISALETRTHEQWVVARQNERRLEESKAEAGQLRNRLTLLEKNLNDSDSETKLHRLEANGETVTSPPLFIGAESSSSPVMFSGSSGVPPPPPSYLHYFPPYLPPLPHNASGLSPYDISQRPPPLGGRLSSPPPMPPLHPPASGGRYENAGSPPPPMSPHLLPPFNRHRSPPPPFGSDHIPPPPPPGSILPPPPLGTAHPWGEESLPPLRNSGFHPHQREQRARNHKGSLHSSGESLDKAHHGKV